MRQKTLNGNEPSDSIRAVNALLTQIDQLKSYSNVLILTTSNISECIDLAFIDRADFKQYIGNPNEKAIYYILSSCINELINKNIIYSSQVNKLLTYDTLKEKLCENIKCENIKINHESVIPLASPFNKGNNNCNNSNNGINIKGQFLYTKLLYFYNLFFVCSLCIFIICFLNCFIIFNLIQCYPCTFIETGATLI